MEKEREKELREYLRFLKKFKKDLHGVLYDWSNKLDNKIFYISKELKK